MPADQPLGELLLMAQKARARVSGGHLSCLQRSLELVDLRQRLLERRPGVCVVQPSDHLALRDGLASSINTSLTL